MQFDLALIPFSRYGSYLAFSHLTKDHVKFPGLYLRSMRGPALGSRPMQEIFLLQVLRDGQPLPFTEVAGPTLLRLEAESGYVEICLPQPHLVCLKVSGVALKFHMSAGQYDYALPALGGRWQVISHTVCEAKYMFTPLTGRLEVDAPWREENCDHINLTLQPNPLNGSGELAIEEFVAVWPAHPLTATFEAALAQVRQEYQDWLDLQLPVPAEYQPARELSAYVNWSSVVAPSGHLTRPAMFASKNGMLGSWSWDHCFHTLALAGSQPQLAWDQFMLLFDHQDESGLLPDWLNDRMISWNFCKPPVHGWVLGRLLENTDLLTKERLTEIYAPLCSWTDWWFKYRDDNGNGLPHYHHGNDSGWDNSTVFAARPPLESPDLAAYLVIQMEVLAKIAQNLGKYGEAVHWTVRATDLLRKLLAHFWREDHFVALRPGDPTPVESDSLLLLMPLILGQRLPEAMRHKLVVQLTTPGQFLTPYGLATERLTSFHYRSKGYWRGPIWAAPTLMLIDGLTACGEVEFATEVRRRFCNLVAANGMAENFDALTGQGYHDLHFPWTANIFLVLANELMNGEKV